VNIRRKILVIDTDPAPARRIENILRSEGYTIYSASTPEQILSVLKETNPSLIFASLSMPEGLEICRRIHSMTAFSKIPIIALVPPEKGKIRYEEKYGIVDCLDRSFGADELILKTETVLSIKEITEAPPKDISDVHQYRPVEEDIFIESDEGEPFIGKEIEPEIPVDKEVEGLIEKSFEPQPEIPSIEASPVERRKKKKWPLVSIIATGVLIISVLGYLIWQRSLSGIGISSPHVVKKVLPTGLTKPAQPLQPIESQRPEQKIPLQGQAETPKTPETPKPIIEPIPKQATKKGRFFSAQVGAYKDIGNAEASVKRLKGKGYDAFIEDITKGNERFHKVLVGKFEDKKKADEMVSTLRARENISAIIYISE